MVLILSSIWPSPSQVPLFFHSGSVLSLGVTVNDNINLRKTCQHFTKVQCSQDPGAAIGSTRAEFSTKPWVRSFREHIVAGAVFPLMQG